MFRNLKSVQIKIIENCPFDYRSMNKLTDIRNHSLLSSLKNI